MSHFNDVKISISVRALSSQGYLLILHLFTGVSIYSSFVHLFSGLSIYSSELVENSDGCNSQTFKNVHAFNCLNFKSTSTNVSFKQT